jgi:hypothetical protein
MDVTQRHFDDLLKELERARIADEELHRRSGNLAERVASHDTLSRLRAEIAQARAARTSTATGSLDTGKPGSESGAAWI